MQSAEAISDSHKSPVLQIVSDVTGQVQANACERFIWRPAKRTDGIKPQGAPVLNDSLTPVLTDGGKLLLQRDSYRDPLMHFKAAQQIWTAPQKRNCEVDSSENWQLVSTFLFLNIAERSVFKL